MSFTPVFEHNTIEFIDIPQDGLEEKVKSLGASKANPCHFNGRIQPSTIT